MANVSRIRVYPIKSLDGIDVESAEVISGGTLSHDREFALFDDVGDVINGKRTDRVHKLSINFDTESNDLIVETTDRTTRRFNLSTQKEQAERWFSEFFETELTLRQDTSNGFVDRRKKGSSVVSTATLRAIASWFDGMSIESARRRLRANIEVTDVPPFWEDQFVGDNSPDFKINGVRFEDAMPCTRCVVPQREPDTGKPLSGFRKRFIQKRQETFPEWADEREFDHHYSAMIITQIPESDRNRTLRVGDSITLVG